MSARPVIALIALGALLAGCGPSKPVGTAGLEWAYPVAAKTPSFTMPPGPFTAPGSARTATLAEVNDEKAPVDWFPGEHPPAPSIIGHEPKGGPMPCAACHNFDGHGFPGIADIGGLPAAYIVEQVRAFRSGDRKSAQLPDRQDTSEMIKVAKQVSDKDLAEAAAYFAALPRVERVKVVESDTAPATTPNQYGWLDVVPGKPAEPLSGRIIEVPADTLRTYMGDPHVGVVAYAPIGAVARGEALVQSGGPGGKPCRSCHGKDLKGQGPIPALAGRAPTYLTRMLWDIKTGARGGPSVEQMQGPAKSLTQDQIRDISAYLGSLKP